MPAGWEKIVITFWFEVRVKSRAAIWTETKKQALLTAHFVLVITFVDLKNSLCKINDW